MATLNFGIMSTASVNGYSFLPVIKKVSGVRLLGIASRNANKAKKYAAKYKIPKSYGSYDDMLADTKIDCVYIPLPVSMHMEWSIKSLRCGKHVLCEKPIAANEHEALAIAEKAGETGLTFYEAFHYRYHPLAARVEELVRGGEVGDVREISATFGVPLREISATFGVPLRDKSKVQFDPALAGGALLDIGCYPVSFARWIADCDDAEVVDAKPNMTKSGVDGGMRATLEFANGVTAKIRCSLVKFQPMHARIKGSKGSIFILMPFTPAAEVGPLRIDTYLLLLRRGTKIRSFRVPSRLTYRCQLEAFCDSVRTGGEPVTSADQGAANMRLIDAIYAKAGLTHAAPK